MPYFGIFAAHLCIEIKVLYMESNANAKWLTPATLFEKYGFEDIKTAFIKLWQINEPKKAGQLNLDGWKEIYERLRTLEPKPSACCICLNHRWEHCSSMIDMNCIVTDKANRGGLCSPLSCYQSWSEIVSMEIFINEDIEISPEELAAGLLWEITYFGGSEEIAEHNRNNLLQLFEPLS